MSKQVKPATFDEVAAETREALRDLEWIQVRTSRSSAGWYAEVKVAGYPNPIGATGKTAAEALAAVVLDRCSPNGLTRYGWQPSQALLAAFPIKRF